MIEEKKINNESLSILQQNNVVCKYCDGYGVLIERECCWDAAHIRKYGCCCGIPNPVELQCNYCHGEGFLQTEKQLA